MNSRKMAIGLPVALVMIVGVSFFVLNRTHGRISSSGQERDYPLNATIVSSGQEREYVLYVPRNYDRAEPTPLIITLHGALLGPAAQMGISRWNRVADKYGFIVVYPSGMTSGVGLASGVLPVWPMEPEGVLKADVTFISDLIDKLEATYNIDPARIYANGFSNGGGMTFALSCTLSHRIAAVGTVAAAQSLPWSWCASSQPVPMITFHGTADRFMPYNGGSSPIAPGAFPSVSAWVANWARRNRCGSPPIESVAAADVTRLEYTNCADDAAVVLYTIKGAGHQWPGGEPMPESIAGSTSSNIDATGLMWAFFREHPLAPK